VLQGRGEREKEREGERERESFREGGRGREGGTEDLTMIYLFTLPSG
jgi:hypothetical protein